MKPIAVRVAGPFPSLAGAPGLDPFVPEAFAAWALSLADGAGRDIEALSRLLLAGFVLSWLPEDERTPLVRSLAWASPTDERMVHRALAALQPADREALLVLVRPAWIQAARGDADARKGEIAAALAAWPPVVAPPPPPPPRPREYEDRFTTY